MIGIVFLILNVVFITADHSARQSLAPRNVTLEWLSDFDPLLSWEPPPHLPEGCGFKVKIQDREKSLKRNELNYTKPVVMDGGSLSTSVWTYCEKTLTSSKPVRRTSINPDLVTALECDIIAIKLIRCSWSPVPGAPHSEFFYRLVSRHGEVVSTLQRCPKVHTDGKLNTCDLKEDCNHNIEILFNGTEEGKLVRNTFHKKLNVKPTILNWAVVKADNKFNISWVCPEAPHLLEWEFTVNYTECASPKLSDVVKSWHTEIHRLPNCRYCFAVKATVSGRTTWTESKCFDADPDVFLLAIIIVPLTCAALAALALVCCMRNKDHIFPPIPKPRDLLSDISDNNNKRQFVNLYFPSEEEDLFKITLVTDHPLGKPEL